MGVTEELAACGVRGRGARSGGPHGEADRGTESVVDNVFCWLSPDAGGVGYFFLRTFVAFSWFNGTYLFISSLLLHILREAHGALGDAGWCQHRYQEYTRTSMTTTWEDTTQNDFARSLLCTARCAGAATGVFLFPFSKFCSFSSDVEIHMASHRKFFLAFVRFDSSSDFSAGLRHVVEPPCRAPDCRSSVSWYI